MAEQTDARVLSQSFISKVLKVPLSLVKSVQRPRPIPLRQPIPRQHDAIERVRLAAARLGSVDLSLRRLHEEVNRENASTLAVPLSRYSCYRIFRDRLGFRFRSYDGANAKYSDPQYDAKRCWVSRLLAQFLLEGAVVLSVDEAAFHATLPAGKRWKAGKANEALLQHFANEASVDSWQHWEAPSATLYNPDQCSHPTRSTHTAQNSSRPLEWLTGSQSHLGIDGAIGLVPDTGADSVHTPSALAFSRTTQAQEPRPVHF